MLFRNFKILKKSSVYMVFFFSYILILIVALSSGFAYYAQITRKITKQTENTKQLLLTELRTSVESSTKYIEELCNEFTFNTKLEQFAKGLPSVTLHEAMQELTLRQKPGDLLFDYFLYIKKTDEIITPNIRMKADKFFDVMYSFEASEYEKFRDQLKGNHFQNYLPIIKVNQYDKNPVDILPLLQTFPVGTKQKPLGQVIIFINAEELFSMVEQFHVATESDIYIYNENNVCILSSSDAPLLPEELVTDKSVGNNTKDSIVFRQLSDTLGWKFIISTPKDLFYSENYDFLLRMIGVTVVYLIIGIVIVSFLAEYSFKPIREIRKYIDKHTKVDGIVKNEFEVIKTTLKEQITNGRELSGLLESQKPIVKREVLGKLLRGMVTDYNSLKERFVPLGITFTTNQFYTVALEVSEGCDFFRIENTENDQSMILAKFILENVGLDLFQEKFNYYYLDMGQNTAVLLLNPLKEEELEVVEEIVYQKVFELNQFLKKYYSLYIYTGISKQHHTLKGIQLCFDEARKALEQHKLYGGFEPYCFSELENLEADYYYPSEMEYQLLRYIKTGESDKAKQLLQSILDINARKKKISTGAARGLLFEISISLKKLFDGAMISSGKESSNLLDLDNYMKAPNLQVAFQDFCSLIDWYQKERAEVPVSNKTKRLVDSIAECIEQNIGENWIDLNGLSSEFGVTPQYISNIFKKYKDENIKDYISKLRLAKAKELLRDTELPIKEIANQLGYVGEIGVIRLFKKYEGITPGDYRNQVHAGS